ncbi:MAG: chloride channel protein [Bdellovibrionales bacterium]|nr:chloride channel protein [Bdellovibrionales bacterium]
MSADDFKNKTINAMSQMPKAWRKISQNYFTKLSKKEVLRLNVLALLVGVTAGYAAIGLRYLIGFLQNLILLGETNFDLVSTMQHTREYWILLILPIGLMVSAFITRTFSKESVGHGVPEVIESVMTKGGKMRKRVAVVKTAASSVTIASGGSVGWEGPIVQIGSVFGSAISSFLNLRPKLVKTLVGCGAAGAIAASFNTPIAGVIFAIEIIILELKTKSFIPLVVASVAGTVVSRHYLGNEPAFTSPEYALVSNHELFFYLLLGILSGVVGVMVIKFLYACEDKFEAFPVHYLVKALFGGLVVAGIGVFYPEVLGVGYETIDSAIHQHSSFELMFYLIFLKIIAMSFTIAAGGSGGVFAPSLFIGAMLGGSFGYIVNWLYPSITAPFGAYALVGMAGMFSATSRATFTAIVILFEMTLDYSIILPLMLVCVAADQVSWLLFRESVYSYKLTRKGLSYVTDIGVNVMSITLIKDIMTPNVEAISLGMSYKDLKDIQGNSTHAVYPVVNEKNILQGVVHQEDLKAYVKTEGQDFKTIIKKPKAVVGPNDSVARAIEKIDKSRDPRILVVNKSTNKLLGIVSPVDLVRLSSNDSDPDEA